MEVKVEDLYSYDKLLDNNGINIAYKFHRSKPLDPDFFAGHNESNSPFGGIANKVFLRCDSKYFSELISLIRQNNCSYVTYLDDLCNKLPDNTPFPLSKISVLLKDVHVSVDASIEEICSNIANILGIPTVYNKSVNLGRQKDYLMSVDCLKSDQKICDNFYMYTYKDFAGAQNSVRLALNRFKQDGKSIPKIQKDRLMEEYLKTYLFRLFVLRDNDFNANNCELVYDSKTQQYSWFPCFDYEHCFSKTVTSDRINSNLKFMQQKYPIVLGNIMKDFSQRLHVLQEQISKCDSSSDKYMYYYNACNNLKEILQAYSNMQKTNSDYVLGCDL